MQKEPRHFSFGVPNYIKSTKYMIPYCLDFSQSTNFWTFLICVYASFLIFEKIHNHAWNLDTNHPMSQDLTPKPKPQSMLNRRILSAKLLNYVNLGDCQSSSATSVVRLQIIAIHAVKRRILISTACVRGRPGGSLLRTLHYSWHVWSRRV